MHELAKTQKLVGASLAPLESFLLARGLRTLHVRMERHGESAMEVAKHGSHTHNARTTTALDTLFSFLFSFLFSLTLLTDDSSTMYGWTGG
jgi:cystathionine beta-lyase/cystathionine gamma-synthase